MVAGFFSDLKLQRAQATHIAQLTALHQEAMTLLAQSDPRFSAQVYTPVNWLSIIEDPNSVLIVGSLDDSVIGYIHGCVRGNSGQVLRLVLDAHRYYGGAGRKLWQELRSKFEEMKVDQIYVCVPRYQAVTQAFWRALGARPLEKNQYPEELEPLPTGMIWMTF